jgi:uncharacterized membrane protein
MNMKLGIIDVAKGLIVAALAGAAIYSSYAAPAAGQERMKNQVQTQTKDQERIYGSELMSDKERNEYRQRMRNANTEQDREKIRNEHHERMLARAKERGVTIPEEPPIKGGGMGADGRGMGPVGGKGGGPRR